MQGKNLFTRWAIVVLLLAGSLPLEGRQVGLAVQQEYPSMLQYLLAERPVLAELVTKAGLSPLLSGNSTYTLLAPPEEALSSLQQEAPERLRAIVASHLLTGAYKENSLKDGARLQTLAGTQVRVCRKEDYTLVDGIRVKEANVSVKNGVVHVIGGIVTP